MNTILAMLQSLAQMSQAAATIADRHARGELTEQQASDEWAGVVSRVTAANAAWEASKTG